MGEGPPAAPRSGRAALTAAAKIVYNLLSNALKFTLSGKVTVRLSPSDDGDAVCLSVADTGCGVPEHELPRLFERFHRVATSHGRSFEGTGIGLALTAELTRLHGGQVAVRSVFGQGSTFSVTIPFGSAHLPPDRVVAPRSSGAPSGVGVAFVEEALRWLPEAPPSSAPAAVPPPPPPAPPATGGSILLVDDNSDMRSYLSKLLGASFVVRTASDGQHALEAIEAEGVPDLVISDWMMPRLDGGALLKALRADARTRHVPVIVLSARAGEEASVSGLQAGADDYLVKPFSAQVWPDSPSPSEHTRTRTRAGARTHAREQADAHTHTHTRAHSARMRPRADATVRQELLARVRTQLELGRLRRDLEDKVQARTQALAESEERYRLLAMLSPVGLFRLGRDAVGAAGEGGGRRRDGPPADWGRQAGQPTMLHLSDRARALLGVEAAPVESVVRIWRERLVLPDAAARFDRMWQQAAQTGKPFFSFEYELRRPGGRTGWLLGQYYHDAASGCLYGALTDISEHRRLEQERLEAVECAAQVQRQRAEEAEEHRHSQEMFVDTICHEIRNPLNGILNNVDLLRRSLEKRRERRIAWVPPPMIEALQAAVKQSDDEDTAALAAIETCANHQRIITNDVLNFSRLKANKLALQVSDFRLGELIAAAVVMFEAEARAHGISLVTELDEAVAGVALRNDPQRLVQILTNLLSNAVKFTRDAPLRRAVVVAASLAPPRPAPGSVATVTFAVRDSGIGISPEGQAQLFQRFGQVGQKSSATYSGGSGLGLSICKLLLDLMGGDIRVRSELGHGTEFTVTVPCEAAAPAGLPAPAAATDAAARPSGRLRVLIVEDNLINQTVLRRQLEQSAEGVTFECAVANHGQEALDLLERGGAFDVVLMDIQMPVLDGIEATRRARARGLRVPIVALSGNARQEHVDVALAAGMQAYVVKPFSRQELVRLILQLCGLT